MPVSINLEGKLAVITGGTMGIGAAIAEELKSAGANLILTGVEKQKFIDRLNKEAEKNNNQNVIYQRLDFTDASSVNEFFNFLDGFEQIDICVNNAGTNRNNLMEDILIEDYNLLLEVNLKGPFLISRYLSRRMKKQNSGRIVNIASIWGTKSREKRAAYTITKSGIIGMTKTSSIELAPYNVLVNAVSPGFTMTELTMKTLPEEEFKKLKEIVPARRFAEPSEIAKTVLFLVSELNTYITGQNIIIDGGFSNV